MEDKNKWLFYLGCEHPNDGIIEDDVSWHIIGNEDSSEITAMFKTWKEAEEYIKFKNTQISNNQHN
jgi:hypothetical protein